MVVLAGKLNLPAFKLLFITSGTAAAMAKEFAADAVADRLGAICVAQLNRDTARVQSSKK